MLRLLLVLLLVVLLLLAVLLVLLLVLHSGVAHHATSTATWLLMLHRPHEVLHTTTWRLRLLLLLALALALLLRCWRHHSGRPTLHLGADALLRRLLLARLLRCPGDAGHLWRAHQVVVGTLGV